MNTDTNAIDCSEVCGTDNAIVIVLLVELTVWNVDRQTNVVLKVKSVRTSNAVISVVLEDGAVLNSDTGASVVCLKVKVRQAIYALVVHHNIAVSCKTRDTSSVNQQQLVSACDTNVSVWIVGETARQ